MPLTQPSAGGLARKNLLVRAPLRTYGPDTSVNFTAAEYDPVNNYGLVGGDNTYVGFMFDLKGGKVEESAALPNSVLGNGNINTIHRNGIDGGVIIRTMNEYARTDDGGASWIDITPPFAVSQNDIHSWQDIQLVNLQREVGNVDIRISADNGATWPDANFTGLPGGSPSRVLAVTLAEDGYYVVLSTNGGLAWTSDKDMTTATFNVFAPLTAEVTANLQAIGANGDASKVVVGDAFGNIAVSIDTMQTWTTFDNDKNIMRFGNASGTTIFVIQYVADLDGFIIMGGTSGVGAFMPADGALDTMESLSYLMATDVTPGGFNSAMTDGIQLVCVAPANIMAMLPFKA